MENIEITNSILKNNLVNIDKLIHEFIDSINKLCIILQTQDNTLHVCNQVETNGYLRLYKNIDDIHRHYIFHIQISDEYTSPINIKVYNNKLEKVKYLTTNIFYHNDINIFMDRFIYFLTNETISCNYISSFANEYVNKTRNEFYISNKEIDNE